jgi:methanethiol S-methyltransferase
MNSYFILIISWAIYFSLHSLLATEKWKRRFDPKGYRVIYSLISVIVLLGLLTLNGSIESAVFFESVGPVKYLSLMLATFGVMTIQLAFRQYSLKSFLGFTEEKTELKEEGI